MLHLEQLDAIPMRSPAGLDPEVTSSKLLTLTTTHKHQLQICKAKQLLAASAPPTGFSLYSWKKSPGLDGLEPLILLPAPPRAQITGANPPPPKLE